MAMKGMGWDARGEGIPVNVLPGREASEVRN